MGQRKRENRMRQRKITERELDIFRKHLAETEKAANTIRKYVRDVCKLRDFAKGKNLSRQLVLRYKEHLKESGKYKASSINSFLIAMNHFCGVMGWNELCVKTIKVQRSAFETEEMELSMYEYRKMVRAALEMRDEIVALILQTIASTGIRVSELCYIDAECLSSGIADIYNKGKIRRILLPSALQRALKAYVERHGIHTGTIFLDKKGRPIDRRDIWKWMKKIAIAAGVPESKAFPHNLRHLFARQFYQQTGDIVKLADVLGHSSIETTRIYVKSTGREHKEQLDRMNMMIEPDVHRTKYEEKESGRQSVSVTQTESGIIIVPGVSLCHLYGMWHPADVTEIVSLYQGVIQGNSSQNKKMLEIPILTGGM